MVLIVSTFLDWIAGREATSDANGFQIPDGRVVLGIGVALLVMGILMAKNKRVGSWFDACLLGVTLSTIALVTVVTFWAYLGSDERSPDIGLYGATAGAAIRHGGLIGRASEERLRPGDRGRRRSWRHRERLLSALTAFPIPHDPRLLPGVVC